MCWGWDKDPGTGRGVCVWYGVCMLGAGCMLLL